MLGILRGRNFCLGGHRRLSPLVAALFVMHLEKILLLLHFTRTVVASLKIRKCLILKKLLSLPAPFQHFRFRVCFSFQPLSSKCFRFHKKLTSSASTSLTCRTVYNSVAVYTWRATEHAGTIISVKAYTLLRAR